MFLVSAVGQFLYQWYSMAGLISTVSFAGWCLGRALAISLCHGCDAGAGTVPNGEDDPIFHGGAAAVGTGAGAGGLAVSTHLLATPGCRWSHWAEVGSSSDAYAHGLVPDPDPVLGPDGELSPAVPGGCGHGRPLHAGTARLRLGAGGTGGAAANAVAEPGPAQCQHRYPLTNASSLGDATPCLGHPIPPQHPRSEGLGSSPISPRGAAPLAEEGEGSAPIAALLGGRRASRGGDDCLCPPGLPVPAPSVLCRYGDCIPDCPLAQQAAESLWGLRLHAGTSTRVHGVAPCVPPPCGCD